MVPRFDSMRAGVVSVRTSKMGQAVGRDEFAGLSLLKIVRDGVEVEGSPEELAAYHRLVARDTHASRLTDFADVGLTPRDEERPTVESALLKFAEDDAVTKKVRVSYARHVRAFQAWLGARREGATIYTAGVADVRDYLSTLKATCKYLKTMTAAGRGRPPLPRVGCLRELFPWTTGTPPPFCARGTCEKWAPQSEGPSARLKAISSFYEFARFHGWVAQNSADVVLQRHEKKKGKSLRKKKYKPTLREVQEILAGAKEILSPRDVALLLCLAKWGRRALHVVLLHASDIHGFTRVDEDGAWADFSGVRDRLQERHDGGRTKLQGNTISPFDPEHEDYFRDVFLPYRQETWGYAWDEGPLFPGDVTHQPLRDDVVQRLLIDRVIEHLARTAPSEADRERWLARLDKRSRTRWTTGSFRHFFTNHLEELGVPRDDVKELRGDRLPGAIEEYRDPTPATIAAKYRAFSVLNVEDD